MNLHCSFSLHHHLYCSLILLFVSIICTQVDFHFIFRLSVHHLTCVYNDLQDFTIDIFCLLLKFRRKTLHTLQLVMNSIYMMELLCCEPLWILNFIIWRDPILLRFFTVCLLSLLFQDNLLEIGYFEGFHLWIFQDCLKSLCIRVRTFLTLKEVISNF